MVVRGIVEDYKVWAVVPSFVVVAVVEIVRALALVMMVLSWVELVVGHFHLQADHKDHMDQGLDISGFALPVAVVLLVEAMVVIVRAN